MFSGIVTDIGRVSRIQRTDDLRARIDTAYVADGIAIGASIACNGVCLTVVDKGLEGAQNWFDVEISDETLSKTNIQRNHQAWQVGTPINLERALKLGDELGGHIVSGHVDGMAEIIGDQEIGGSRKLTFRAPDHLAKFIAEKGSIALNGTSLTVNAVDGANFDINLIPHTQKVTTWGSVAKGDFVNLEIDTLARYVARMAEFE